MDVDDERHRLQQQLRLETRDIGAVAAPDIQDPDDLESLHGLSQRTAGQPERFAQFLLRGHPSPGLSSPERIMPLILRIASSVTAMIRVYAAGHRLRCT
jgi:hypothetical protein